MYSSPAYGSRANHCGCRVHATDTEDYFEIPIAATQACDYDRTFAVEVLEQETNAIEGRHYSLEQNTLTIKAA